jgi:hypothetical protein
MGYELHELGKLRETEYNNPFLTIFYPTSPSLLLPTHDNLNLAPLIEPEKLYDEYGMNTEESETWDFKDQQTTQYSDETVRWWLKLEQERICEHEESIREYKEYLQECEELKREELEHDELECEEQECEREELDAELKLPPSTPVNTPTQPLPETANRNIHHTIPQTVPYSTSRPHPPSWPNKHQHQNGNRYGNNKYTTKARNHKQHYTPCYAAIHRCPPPWPIKTSLSPISLISNSRPPPWPNQHHCHHHYHHRPNTKHYTIQTPHAHPPPWPILTPDTLQNHQNVRHQLRGRS